MPRLHGIPISDDDARHLVATLLVEGTPNALSAAAMITKGVTAVGSSGQPGSAAARMRCPRACGSLVGEGRR